jgi:molybdopterin-guanine dinucleotide biosynthesis protein A
MHRWLQSLGVVPVDFNESEAFANINTPAKAG